MSPGLDSYVPGGAPAAHIMKLSQLLRPSTIRLDLAATSKEDLIRQAVGLFEADPGMIDPAALTEALLERERVMSTGIGGGVAIPHAQSSTISSLAVSFIRLDEELAFDALDGKPIRIVFTIVGPEERGGFIRILARISRLLYTGGLQRELMAA